VRTAVEADFLTQLAERRRSPLVYKSRPSRLIPRRNGRRPIDPRSGNQLDLWFGSDRPDVTWTERWLGANDFAFVPRRTGGEFHLSMHAPVPGLVSLLERQTKMRRPP
jgi:hypothetical protein